MNNTPKVKIGIVAVSRDCFPETLSVNRSVLSKVRFIWFRHWRTLKRQDAMHFVYIWAILDLKFRRRCWQSILKDRKCL